MNSQNIRSLSIIYFSPTGTTKKIVNSIAKGMHIEQIQNINLTLPENRENQNIEITGDIIIIGIPVYKGEIPDLLYGWLHKIHGNGRPVILISVYGNVKSGMALQQLQNICELVDLIPVGAASFIGEHSFSTEKLKIAVNKPDEHELKNAFQFGSKLIEKINSLNNLEDGRISLPKAKKTLRDIVMPKNGPQMFTRVSEPDSIKCNHCKICINNCPVSAIEIKTLKVNMQKCIRCMGCVKCCPKGAREIIFKNNLLKYIIFRKASRKCKETQFYM